MSLRRRRSRQRRVDGIVLLDKPRGLTSNQALQHVRLLYRAEKAGHTGSLDPLATGLLPICLGEATKLCGVMLDGIKHYEAVIFFGSATQTGDAEGDVIAHSDFSLIDMPAILAVLPRFLGQIQQIPPMYSALKHQGQPLYELARAGMVVERPPRQVSVLRLEPIVYEAGALRLEVVCSKGTYIRTLAEDIAAALGQKAHLGALRRLGAEPFHFPIRMFRIDELTRAAEESENALDELLLPAAKGLSHWPSWQAPDESLRTLLKGNKLPPDSQFEPGPLAVIDAAGCLRVLAKVDAKGWINPDRCLLAPSATCDESL